MANSICAEKDYLGTPELECHSTDPLFGRSRYRMAEGYSASGVALAPGLMEIECKHRICLCVTEKWLFSDTNTSYVRK